MAVGSWRTNALCGIGRRSLLATLIWFMAQPAVAATLSVAVGGDLQGALNSAHCGDTIVLKAGAAYTTTYGFVLPYKACTGTDADYITITTSGQLPPEGTRLDPGAYAGSLARLVATSSFPIVSTPNPGHHWKFVGIDFTSNGSYFFPAIIILGSSPVTGDEPTLAQRQLMKGFVIDRCFIHPPEISATSLSNPSGTRSIERGIQANVNDAR